MKVTSWAPGHATLFFAVPNHYNDLLKMGSIGGGLNFQEGVITEIERSNKTSVSWNNQKISGEVSLTALDLFNKRIGKNLKVTINHRSELKIGHGLSTSGAGSLGVLLGLNKLMQLEISEKELFDLAHIVDAKCNTGLGSVTGQVVSNIELRMTQGAPSLCKTKSFQSNQRIIICQIAPLKTVDVLTSETQMKQVTNKGTKAVEKAILIKENVLENFIKLGRTFSETCGLLTPRMNDYFKELMEFGEDNVCMAMIGETLIVLPHNFNLVENWLHEKGISYIITKITSEKPKNIEI